MRKFYQLVVAILIFASATKSHAQDYWKAIADATVSPSTKTARTVYPTQYATFSLQTAAFKQQLHAAPQRILSEANQSGLTVQLPNPQGGLEAFELIREQLMEPELAAKYPEIETYMGRSLSNPANTIRLESTPHGITAMIFAADGKTYIIDPYSNMTTAEYMVYLKSSYPKDPSNTFNCLFDEHSSNPAALIQNRTTAGLCGELRTYRTAIAASGEYTAFHGGTVALGLAAITTSVNRLNGIFEREFSVRLILVANNNLIIYTDAGTDPYNGSAGSDINTNNTNLNTVIGSANYDFGHLYGAASLAGLAGLGVVCTTGKGRGVTGSAAPIGDPFVVDYVAHEMGHQMSGNHTQYNACNNNTATAMEPGSASSIMGYAGICSPNVQNNSDDYFHAINLQEITTYMHSGSGNSCPVKTTLTNVAPSFTLTQVNRTIPKGTPFFLTMAATDANSDVLTYAWEQMDGGSGQTMPPTGNNTSGPVFRSKAPTSSGTRFFPPLANVISGTSPTWEVLPQVARTLNFRGTVRDNRSGGGCSVDHNTVVTVSSAGPFVVTNPNAAVTLTASYNELITWDVAGTNAAPVNCTNVDITLSTDGGITYPITLASNVPNTGSATIVVPNNPGLSNRVRIQSVGNIFYDISNSDFAIQAPASPDYQIWGQTQSVTACSNATALYNVDVRSILGFNGAVTLSTVGLPMGVVATFGSNPVNAGGTTTLTLSNLSGVSPGSYNFSVSGSGTPGTRNFTFQLVVLANTVATPTLSTPANNATGVSTQPTLQWTAVSGATYDLQIATDASFTAVVLNQTNVSANSFAVTTALNTGTNYWWRVRAKTSCVTGSYTGEFAFTTSATICTNFVSTDVPKTIGLAGNIFVNSTVSPTGTATITDVDVLNVNITHSYVSDLTVSLIHPDNTTALLIDAANQCSGSQDNMNLSFDQESSNLYSAIPCPPTNAGTYQPKTTLTTLYGKPGAGTWTLQVNDRFNDDGGSINSWTLRLCFASGTLPVNYRSFTANASNNHIALNWITANELNNKGYYLQRSVDGINYTNITFVAGKGNSGTDNSYFYYDFSAQTNVLYYYRLQQVDQDGRISYSSTAQAIISKKDGGIKIYPNPATTTLQLIGNSTYKNASVQILNSKGQLMQSSTLINTNTTLNIETLPTGIYLLKISKDGVTETQKFIKQ
jgi:subtilisin-like proprotein convertase family protein